MKLRELSFEPLVCAVPGAEQRMTKQYLVDFWLATRELIEKRLDDFRAVNDSADDHALFCELMFCLFTPQSKAVSCWAAVRAIREEKLVVSGTREMIAEKIHRRVRFHRNKSGYVVEARQKFLAEGRGSLRGVLDGFSSSREAREWLVKNVRGLGYKEASHFLRNIGRGGDIAILDRHILKGLKELGVIAAIPDTLTPRKYLEIENRMASFSRSTGIPMDHLDLLFWCRKTGEIFK